MSEREVSFRSFDGVGLNGTYSEADGVLRHAALLVHGIDSDRNEYGFYSRMAKALSTRGIATLRFDWRCYGADSQRPISELTLAGIANDIEAAAAQLLSECGLESMNLIAASFGGGVAVAWSLWTDVGVDRIVLLAPVLDYAHDYLLQEGLGTTRSGVSEAAARQLAEDGILTTSGRPFSRQLVADFPHYSATPPPEAPTLIIHGTSDTGVPFQNSSAYADVYAGRVSLREFPGVEHGFAAPGDSELVWPETLANHKAVYGWIVDYLSGSER